MRSDRGFENAPNSQLVAIIDGLNSRITTGIIPKVDAFASDFVKGLGVAPIITPAGLRMKVYANERIGHQLVESVTVLLEDYGNDSELKELIKERHGNVPLHGVEIILAGDLPDDNGTARVISPEGLIPAGTSTRTYTYISPDVTEVLLKRIPA